MRGHLVHRKAGWDCHGLPVELEIERELGISSKADIERYGIAEFNAALPRVGVRVHRRVEPAHRADRLLDRHRRRVRNALERLHRVGLVVAQGGLEEGAPGRGHSASCPTARAAAPRSRRTRWRRATATWWTRRCSCASRSAARRACRCSGGPRRRGRSSRTRRSPCTPTSTYAHVRVGRRDADPGRGTRRAGARARTPRSSGAAAAASSPAPATSRRSPTSRTTASAATPCSRPTSSPPTDGTGVVHTAVAFGEDDFRLGERYGLKLQNPVRAGRHLRRARGAVRRPLRQGRRRRHRRGAARVRPPAPRRASTSTPTRTAGAATRRSSTTRSRAGTCAPPRSATTLLRANEEVDLVPGPHQARPLRQVAREQRRLGAVARALLGHAAAGLALRGGSRPVRGVDRRAARPRRGRPGRPPQALHRRGLVRLPGVRRGDAPRARGDRRLVGLRLDAVRAVARARSRTRTPSRTASPPTTSARRWTRRAGGSTRCWRSPPSCTGARRTRPCSAWD